MATKNISPQFNKPGIYKVINGAPKIATTQEASSPGSSLGYTPGRGLAPGPQSGNGTGVPYIAGPGITIDRNQIEVVTGTGLGFDSSGNLINTAGLPVVGPNGDILQVVSGAAAWVTWLAAAPIFTAAGATPASTFHIVTGSITAGGISTPVTLSGSAVFSSATSYGIYSWNATTHAVATTVTAQSASSFTIATVAADVYIYFAFGT